MYKILTSFEKDLPEVVDCVIRGSIPGWLNGSLIRNGCGLFQFGPDTYRHLFDGMAVVHKYAIRDGTVKYQNRLIDSESFRRNKSAGRIVASEFGTIGVPDPNETFMKRYFSYYFGFLKRPTDNTCVTVVQIKNRLFALTETSRIIEIGSEDLRTKSHINLQNYVKADTSTAHVLLDDDGTAWNVGSQFSYPSKYIVMKIPPNVSCKENPFESVKVVATIPARWKLEPGYYHSFGMSRDLLVFIEQTTCVPILKMAMAAIRRQPFADNMISYQNEKCLFHVINKTSGAVQASRYSSSEPFFTFHHVNTFEDAGHLVVDVSAYSESGSHVINTFVLDEFQRQDQYHPQPQLWRFALPLRPKQDCEPGVNQVTLDYTTATAVRQSDGSFVCTPQKFDKFFLELSGVNPSYAGRKYRFVYGLTPTGKSSEFHRAGSPTDYEQQLAKYDLKLSQMNLFSLENYIAGEPVFVPRPQAVEEDDGVILSPMISSLDDCSSFLLILDGKTFTETGRAEIPRNIKVPYTFHGIFI